MTKGVANEALTKRVEVFRPGTFRAMNGTELTFTAEDVAKMASAYDPEKAPAPVVVGHPKHDDPAFGWADHFEVNAEGVLVAEIGRLSPSFVDAVEEGRYRKVSMMFFPPDAPSNPSPGSYYPRHIGFLGGAAPAVPGLQPVQFADAADAEMVEISFADGAFRDVAGLFRRLREWLIGNADLETADSVLPDYTINWINEAAREPDDGPRYVAPTPLANSQTTETQMSKQAADALTAREAALAQREAALNHADHVAFADGLVSEGKMLPALKDRAVALLDQLAASEREAIAFADGGEQKTATAVDLMRGILSEAPKIVAFGKTDLGAAPADGGGVAFAVADHLPVDAAQLEIHNAAIAYQNTHTGVDYMTAVRSVQSSR